MRARLGAGLLLVSTMLVGVAATPAEAATGCDAPDTTWLGPATEGGSVSWAKPTNWTNGVPTATSVVCIPGSVPGPHVEFETDAMADVIDAAGATVELEGDLTLGTRFDVARLVGVDGPLGSLVGPGATTNVSESLTGGLTLDGVVLNKMEDASAVLGEWWVVGGAHLNVHGDAGLEGDIESWGSGLFTICEDGSLTVVGSARVQGGFANHGEVIVSSGQSLTMLGAGAPAEPGAPEQFSTGRFTAAPEADLWIAHTELRTGAVLEHVMANNIVVPAGNRVTASHATLVDWSRDDPPRPSFLGAGELVVTDGSRARATIGDSLTVTVPDGETFELQDSIIKDQAHVQVFGELTQYLGTYLEDDALLEVHGVHRVSRIAGVSYSGTDPGLEVISPGGQLVVEEPGDMYVGVPFVIEGAVDSASSLALADTTTLTDGASITGAVKVLDTGLVRADLGPAGTAFLTGAEVAGTVRANSGTLKVVAPDPASWTNGKLTGGTYVAAHGAKLRLPTTDTLAADLRLVDPDSSFGAGLGGLRLIAPAGELELLRGADLATIGGLENRGRVSLSSASDLDVDGRFAQGRDARLTTQLSADGRGQVVASGRLDLAGDLMLDRDGDYRPAVGTTMRLLKGSTRRDTKFARVLGRDPYANRRCLVDYSQPDQVRLRVEGLS